MTVYYVYMYIGWPGKVRDAQVIANVLLYMRRKSGQLLPPRTKKIGNCNVTPIILGDLSHPLMADEPMCRK